MNTKRYIGYGIRYVILSSNSSSSSRSSSSGTSLRRGEESSPVTPLKAGQRRQSFSPFSLPPPLLKQGEGRFKYADNIAILRMNKALEGTADLLERDMAEIIERRRQNGSGRTGPSLAQPNRPIAMFLP